MNKRLQWGMFYLTLPVWVALGVYLGSVWADLPQRMAVHFDATSAPNSWVDKQVFIVGLFVLSGAVLAIFAFLLKRGGGLSLAVGAWAATFIMSGVTFEIVQWNLRRSRTISVAALISVGMVMIVAVVVAIANGYRSRYAQDAVIGEQVHRSGWSAAISTLFLLLPLGIAFSIRILPVFIVCGVCGCIALYVLLLTWGGFTYRVTRSGVEVRGAGRVLEYIRQNDIQKVAVDEVNPLKDFGGWGIRGTDKKRAYIWGGHQVLHIWTAAGEVLLATKDPASLAEYIEAAGAK